MRLESVPETINESQIQQGCQNRRVSVGNTTHLDANPHSPGLGNGAFHAIKCGGTTLASWGLAASNAIPSLLDGLSAQSKAGGPIQGSQFRPGPSFGRALATIGPDSREVMMALLTAKSTLRAKHGIFLGGGDIHIWCDRSRAGRPMLRAVVTDKIVPIPIRIEALHTLVTKGDTNLIPLIPAMLDEPALRIRAVGIVRHIDSIPAPIFAAIVQAVARDGQEDQAFLEEAHRQVMERGREHAAFLIPQLLPLSFDERYPINCGFPADQGIPVWEWARTAIQILDGGQEVIKALRHPDWKVRNASAARLWGNSEFSAETISSLVKCLHDTNEIVRLSAAVTLSGVTDQKSSAVSNILSAANSPTLSSALRLHAVRMVRHLHLRPAEFPSVTRVLKSALGDSDPMIREAASQSLKELSPEDQPKPGL